MCGLFFFGLYYIYSEDKPPTYSYKSIARPQSYQPGRSKHFTMVFWKFTVLFDHRHRFFLCRKNQYGSSMIQCIYQISTQNFGKDLMVVIVWLRSAEAILKRAKSVNHCCTERISMHCYSNPHFSTVLANDYRIRKIQSVRPNILIWSHFEMKTSTNSEDCSNNQFPRYNQPICRV